MLTPARIELKIYQGKSFWHQIRIRPDAKRVVGCTNVVNPTVTLDEPHGLTTGQTVVVTGVRGAWGLNGSWPIASVPSLVSMVLTIPTAPGVFETSIAKPYAWAGRLFDLTGYSARLKARDAAGNEVLSLTSGAGGGLTLGGPAGTVTVERTATQTAAMTFGFLNYDLEVFTAADAIVESPAYGSITLISEQTR